MTDIIVINEVRSNHSGVDTDEFFELSGTPGASLDGLFFVAIGAGSGSNIGVVEAVIDLSGFSLGDDGLFFAAERSAGGRTPDLDLGSIDDNGLDLQNQDNTTYLLVRNFSGAVDGEDLDTDDDGILDVTPWDVVLDAVSLIGSNTSGSLPYSSVQVGPDGDFSPGQIFRTTDTTGEFGVGDFDFGVDDTPGALNDPDGPGNSDLPDTAGSTGGIPGRLDANADGIEDGADLPDPVTTTVSEVQGDGAASPLVGQRVTIQAYVSGDFQSNGLGADGDLGGFFVQSLEGDDNDATSDGVFIQDGSAPDVDVISGSFVEITGTVRETGGETRIVADTITIVDTVDPVDIDDLSVSLDLTDISTTTTQSGDTIPNLEAYEGMLVVVSDLSVVNIRDVDRFGSFTAVQGDVPLQFTQFNVPNVEANIAYVDSVIARSIVIDDGFLTENPSPVLVGGTALTEDLGFSTGDTISSITGVLRFGQAEGTTGGNATFRLDPVSDFDVEDTNPRDTLDDFDDNGLVIASFNVENFFTSLDNADNLGNDNPLGSERGADTLEEFERQLARLVDQILAMDADVLALQEVENNGLGSGSATQALVDALNNQLGEDVYAAVTSVVDFEGNVLDRIGGDAIQNVVLYRTDRVEIAEGSQAVALTDDALPSLGITTDTRVFNGAGSGRPPVVVTFADLETGNTFTIVNNHYQSRGFSSADPEPDIGDGQGNNNLSRTLASEAVLEFLETNPTGVASETILIVGDLNAYAQEDPLTTLEAGGFTNLSVDLDDLENVTFVFGDFVGALDHALGSAALLEQVLDVAIFNVNAEESELFDYNLFDGRDTSLFATSAPIRASDHNAVLVSLDLDGNDETLEGTDGDDTIDGGSGDDVIVPGAGADAIDGGTGFDVVSYADEASEVFIDLASNFITGSALGDSYTSVEGFIGTAFNDVISGDDNDNAFQGLAGPDRLVGRDGDDTLEGGAGNDTLVGETGDDVLNGGGGADNLVGGAGSDALAGSIGDDLLEGGNGFDTLSGQAGNDRLVGGSGRDVLIGGPGADSLEGGQSAADIVVYSSSRDAVNVELREDGLPFTASGGDAEGDFIIAVEQVTGTGFDDTIAGNNLNNRLNGLGGDDQLSGGDGDDVINGGAGDDTLIGGAGADRINGQVGFDLVDYSGSPTAVTISLANGTGSGGDALGDELIRIEAVLGTPFNDSLFGSRFDNQLEGGDGDDRIAGLGGDDTLIGGAGADTFVFAEGSDTDIITDFDPTADILDLQGIASDAQDLEDLIAETQPANGTDLLLDLGGGDTVLLLGVTTNDLTAGNFIF